MFYEQTCTVAVEQPCTAECFMSKHALLQCYGANLQCLQVKMWGKWPLQLGSVVMFTVLVEQPCTAECFMSKPALLQWSNPALLNVL
jgi:hypothetical protein